LLPGLRRLSCDQDGVAEGALPNCVCSGIGQSFDFGEIEAGDLQLAEACCDLYSKQSRLHVAHHLCQNIIVDLGRHEGQSCILRHGSIVLERLRIPDAGDPCKQSVKLGQRCFRTRKIADPDVPAWSQDARKFGRSNVFSGKRAECAFAYDRVKTLVRGRETFRIRQLELHPVRQLPRFGFGARRGDVLLAEIDSGYTTTEHGRQRNCACPTSGRHIENMRIGREPQQIADPPG